VLIVWVAVCPRLTSLPPFRSKLTLLPPLWVSWRWLCVSGLVEVALCCQPVASVEKKATVPDRSLPATGRDIRGGGRSQFQFLSDKMGRSMNEKV
jgi:hypothetical protein